MKKIIKPGDINKVFDKVFGIRYQVCPNCQCEFIYQEEDTFVILNPSRDLAVKCPFCEEDVILKREGNQREETSSM